MRTDRLRRDRDYWRTLALETEERVRAEMQVEIDRLSDDATFWWRRAQRAEARVRSVERTVGWHERRTGQMPTKAVRDALHEPTSANVEAANAT